MSQSLQKLKDKVNKLDYIIQERGDGLVQQVLSTPHYLCFQVRFKGKTIFLYIGRGGAFQGFDFTENKIPAFLRVQDRFVQFARKNWRGMRLIKIQVGEFDRVLSFVGFKERERIQIHFFWRGRDLFFAHEQERGDVLEVFQSWAGKQNIPKDARIGLTIDSLFPGLGFGSLKSREKLNDFSIEEYLTSFEKNKEVGEALKTKKLKTIAKMRQELKRFDVLEYLEKQTSENLENVKSIGEGRFKVLFRGLEGHFKKREYLYDKIKIWKSSQNQLLKRLNDLEKEVADQGIKKEVAYFGKTIEPVWNYKVEKENIKKNESFISFKYKDWPCYLGRTALENDQIRKEVAKKEDWWIHLENYRSGHLFVKSAGEDIGPLDLTILASALVEMSNLSLTEIPIIFTQVKNLKGVKGIAGMVNYKKEKHLVVYFDREWRQKLTNIEVDAEG